MAIPMSATAANIFESHSPHDHRKGDTIITHIAEPTTIATTATSNSVDSNSSSSNDGSEHRNKPRRQAATAAQKAVTEAYLRTPRVPVKRRRTKNAQRSNKTVASSHKSIAPRNDRRTAANNTTSRSTTYSGTMVTHTSTTSQSTPKRRRHVTLPVRAATTTTATAVSVSPKRNNLNNAQCESTGQRRSTALALSSSSGSGARSAQNTVAMASNRRSTAATKEHASPEQSRSSAASPSRKHARPTKSAVSDDTSDLESDATDATSEAISRNGAVSVAPSGASTPTRSGGGQRKVDTDQTPLAKIMQSPELFVFAGRLTPQEADTTRYRPSAQDRLAFERSHRKAEPPVKRPVHASQARRAREMPPRQTIRLGQNQLIATYSAPYPEEYANLPLLHLCEYCLKYMKCELTAERHKEKCPMRHPPGDEIYREGKLSIFEVDGRKNKIYCQHLCLLAKMFLDHKTLYYDVEPFLFYVLTETTQNGFRFLGYFSKEKRSAKGYNLSCIVVLPSERGAGYGQLLIDFSYLLSRKEGRPGGPETPLSDLGEKSYKSYWRGVIEEQLLALPDGVTADELALQTGMTREDVVETLREHSLISVHLPDVASTEPSWAVTDRAVLAAKVAASHRRRVDPAQLRWSPFLLKRPLVWDPADDDDDASAAAATVAIEDKAGVERRRAVLNEPVQQLRRSRRKTAKDSDSESTEVDIVKVDSPAVDTPSSSSSPALLPSPDAPIASTANADASPAVSGS